MASTSCTIDSSRRKQLSSSPVAVLCAFFAFFGFAWDLRRYVNCDRYRWFGRIVIVRETVEYAVRFVLCQREGEDVQMLRVQSVLLLVT